MENIFPALACPAKWDKLLVCTDGSIEANNAVAGTLDLAKACGSQVFVVQVLEIVPEFQAVMPDLRAPWQKRRRAIWRSSRPRPPNWRYPSTSDARRPAALCRHRGGSRKDCPDLVIMGRRGKHGLADILMGSVTARVIGHSPVNVLVVPQGGSIGFQRILVASDGSLHSEVTWELALSMAKQAASQLIAVAVAPEEGDIIEAQALIHKMLTAANRAGMPFKGVSPQGVAPDAGIIQQAIKNEVDLIIMGSHGRTGLKKLLMGSVTERVIGQAPCPVLVVKKMMNGSYG